MPTHPHIHTHIPSHSILKHPPTHTLTHTLTLTFQILSGHSSAVNDLTFNPCDPTLLASVGDDRVCRVWDLNKGQLRSEFTLRSPGMAVKWHPREPATVSVVCVWCVWCVFVCRLTFSVHFIKVPSIFILAIGDILHC